MLTKRYMSGTKTLPGILRKIQEGTAPPKFNLSHLKGIGFKSSNDQAVIPLLKDLGFLTAEGTPTPRYHAYRDPSRSRAVMAEALREAYDGIFHLNEKPSSADRKAIVGKFKSTHNVSDRVAELQAMTFLGLLAFADLESSIDRPNEEKPKDRKEVPKEDGRHDEGHIRLSGLHYNVQIHLPATKDIEVFNSIFKSLKEHLLAK